MHANKHSLKFWRTIAVAGFFSFIHDQGYGSVSNPACETFEDIRKFTATLVDIECFIKVVPDMGSKVHVAFKTKQNQSFPPRFCKLKEKFGDLILESDLESLDVKKGVSACAPLNASTLNSKPDLPTLTVSLSDKIMLDLTFGGIGFCSVSGKTQGDQLDINLGGSVRMHIDRIESPQTTIIVQGEEGPSFTSGFIKSETLTLSARSGGSARVDNLEVDKAEINAFGNAKIDLGVGSVDEFLSVASDMSFVNFKGVARRADLNAGSNSKIIVKKVREFLRTSKGHGCEINVQVYDLKSREN